MTTFLALTVVGVVDGCIYALTATGLVVTYITSGVFNFAHGAIGMFAAFAYWELSVKDHWPVPLAIAVVLFVIAPLIGFLIDGLIMRGLQGKPVEVSLMATVGLLLAFLGVAEWRWDPGRQARILPHFFAGRTVKVFSVFVSYHEITVVLAAVAVALGLRLFLFRTRPGIALRAVVDAPELTALNGARPARVSQLGWAIGCSLAALAGILLAPLVTLDHLLLTLLVINGYAAAIVGKLKNLPLTFAGGVALGLFEAYAVGYLPGSVLSQLKPTLPVIFLYVALLAVPQRRLRVGRALSSRSTRVPGLRTSLLGGVALVAGSWVITRSLSVTNLFTFGKGVAIAMVVLSLVLLTGYAGQISLCQWTFAGVGAFAMGKVGHGSLLGVLAAIGLAAAVGALSALPALRLQGLYLALITLAFAEAMTSIFFENNHVFAQGGALKVARLHFLGLSFASNRSFVMLSVVALAGAGIGVVALRRSSFGRRLAAMSDSPDACTTLGMSLTWTKFAVFSLSAALAGLAGVFFGGLRGSVGSNDFVFLNSLAALLLLAIWGIDSVAAAVAAGMVFALVNTNVQSHFSHIPNLVYLLTGLGALGLARNPEGAVRQFALARDRLRRLGTPIEPARSPAETLGTVGPAVPLAGGGIGGLGPLSLPGGGRPVLNGGRSRPARPRLAPARAPASVPVDGARPAVPALEVLGLRAAYGRVEVLHGIDLVVPPSTVFALLGPNGAGKSTVLKVVSGTLAPTAGCVHIAGVHVNGASPDALARLGVCTIPEGRGVFANLTVAENLRMMSYRDGVQAADIEETAYTRFPRLGERRHQLAGTLSGGEQQMLALARAVSTHPSLLLLDEISLGLAPLIVSELYDLVGQLAAEGIAILLVEQFVRTAMRVADYAAVMSQGRIERIGQGADVVGAVSAAYMGAVG